MERAFIAKIIWQIKIPTNSINFEFDEQLRIIRANDSENALKKAIQIGHTQEETFLNSRGQKVEWSFINVVFIKEITSFDDGSEICNQTINAPDALQFIKDIHIKSEINANALLHQLI